MGSQVHRESRRKNGTTIAARTQDRRPVRFHMDPDLNVRTLVHYDNVNVSSFLVVIGVAADNLVYATQVPSDGLLSMPAPRKASESTTSRYSSSVIASPPSANYFVAICNASSLRLLSRPAKLLPSRSMRDPYRITHLRPLTGSQTFLGPVTVRAISVYNEFLEPEQSGPHQ